MKKSLKEKNNNELWFNWLTQKLYSYEAFKEFDSGQNPEDVAENFIYLNRSGIIEIFEEFDDEDKDALDQFQKLIECEWHVFRLLKNQLEYRNNVKFVDFKNRTRLKN